MKLIKLYFRAGRGAEEYRMDDNLNSEYVYFSELDKDVDFKVDYRGGVCVVIISTDLVYRFDLIERFENER